MSLIDRNKLLDELLQMYSTLNRINIGNPSLLRELETVIKTVEDAPTIDAAPIVRAHWEDCDLTDGKDMVEGGYKRCSNCHGFGFISENWYGDLTDQYLTDYCPDCGARISS